MGKTQRRGFITGGTWCVDNNRMVTHWPGEDGHAQFFGKSAMAAVRAAILH